MSQIITILNFMLWSFKIIENNYLTTIYEYKVFFSVNNINCSCPVGW